MWYRKKGIDVNFAKRQKWWGEIEGIVETDIKTTKNLVENIYLNVCDAKLGELKFATDVLVQTKDIPGTLEALAQRQAAIEHFKKLENLREVRDETR
jgi:hypothetical protein